MLHGKIKRTRLESRPYLFSSPMVPSIPSSNLSFKLKLFKIPSNPLTHLLAPFNLPLKLSLALNTSKWCICGRGGGFYFFWSLPSLQENLLSRPWGVTFLSREGLHLDCSRLKIFSPRANRSSQGATAPRPLYHSLPKNQGAFF